MYIRIADLLDQEIKLSVCVNNMSRSWKLRRGAGIAGEGGVRVGGGGGEGRL